MPRYVKVLSLAILTLSFLLTIQPHAAPTQLAQGQIQDTDRDGVPDDVDECPDTHYSEPVDGQGCSIRDLCPCTHPWKNDGQYARCVAQTSQEFVKAGLITNKVRSVLVSDAAKHGCISPPPTIEIPCYVGTPNKLPLVRAGDSLEVVFAVVGDPQFHQPYETFTVSPSDKLLRQQLTVEETHVACRDADPSCTGVVVVGDLTQEAKCKQLLAFRQLYEWGYKSSEDLGFGEEWCNWDDSLYGWGYLLNRPMYPMWGNHDKPNDGDTIVAQYLKDLVYASPALYDSPIELKEQGIRADSWFDGRGFWDDVGIYAWEWGNFHFISLGLWAFYDGFVGDDSIDPAKVEWLEDHLASVGHEKAIVLFQHYGFDKCYNSGCSFEEAEQRWWTFENAKQLINVLCNRNHWSEPCGTPDKPRYNVVGLISGHIHEYGFCRLCPEKANGNFMSWDDGARCQTNVDDCDVYIDNFQVNDAGESETPGYTMVRLNAWPKDVRPADPYASTIAVQGFELRDWSYDSDNYNWDFNCKYNNEADYTLFPKRGFQNPISTAFLTFRQGEPNGGRAENCAEFLTDGRMNDVDCWSYRCAACYDQSKDDWQLTGTRVQFNDAWEACLQLGPGYQFSTPRNLQQQAQLSNAVRTGVNELAWVNYTDYPEEDHWIPASWIYAQFDVGEPNGGQLENCAQIKSNGALNDGPCAQHLPGACLDADGNWQFTTNSIAWDEGWAACSALGYDFGVPRNPDELEQLWRKVNETAAVDYAWINYNDLRTEGTWQTVPSFAFSLFAAGEPNGGDIENCALLKQDGTLNDLSCSRERHGACLDSEGNWHMTPVPTAWAGGWAACSVLGYDLGVPRNYQEHERLMDMVNHHWGVDLWVDYSDLRQEGYWEIVPSWPFTLFAAGEPNGGPDENCAELNLDGRLSDVACTSERYGACTAPDGTWHLTTDPIAWGDGWQACSELGYAFGVPRNPEERTQLLDRVTALGAHVWANYSDIREEGVWEIAASWMSTQFGAGEPNGGEVKNCAEFGLDGKLNDIYCTRERYGACLDSGGNWQTTPGVITWDEGWAACSALGYDFGVPRSPAEQEALKDAANALGQRVWVNYSDRRQEGHWEAAPSWMFTFFDQGEPNDGAHLPEQGWGENCAILKSDGRLRDVRCEQELHRFVCKRSDGTWFISQEEGLWKQGFDGTFCGDLGYVAPATAGESSIMLADVGADLAWAGQAWLGLNDVDEEGDWVSKGEPWEPTFSGGNSDAKDCAFGSKWADGGDVTWLANQCAGGAATRNYACRSDETGEWVLTTGEGGDWEDGFEHCRAELGPGWRYEGPISKQTAEDLLIDLQALYPTSAKDFWLNYTDARQEGVWEHAHWENWAAGSTGDASHNCASMDASGEWTARSCLEQQHPVCSDSEGNVTSHDGMVSWYDAFDYCKDQGKTLALPYNPSENQGVVSISGAVLADGAWIRYTLSGPAGPWQDWPQATTSWSACMFDQGQPNDGAHLPEQGWGEDCAVLKANGLLRDARCEHEVLPFVCRGSDGTWFITQERGLWVQGFDSGYCGDLAFATPTTDSEFQAMLEDVSAGLPAAGQAWLSLNDLEEEGDWVNEGLSWQPVFEDAEPTTGDDCGLVDNWDPGGGRGWWSDDCEASGWPFYYACRSDTTGAWSSTAPVQGVRWWDGFENCRSELGPDWRFDGPISQQTTSDLRAYMNENGLDMDPIWVNATDARQEGVWQHGHWENWAMGQPDNANGDEDCAALTMDGKWMDHQCYMNHSFICRDSAGSLSLVDMPVEWMDAVDWCWDLGGTLALPNSPTEMQELMDVAGYELEQAGIWIRYTDASAEGRWVDWPFGLKD